MIKRFYGVYGVNFSLSIILGYIKSLVQLFIMYEVSNMFNNAIGGKTEYILNETPKFIAIVLIFTIINAISEVFIYLKRQKNKQMFKENIYRNVLKSSFITIEQKTFGEVITRLNKDTDNIIEILSVKLSLVIISMLTFITYFAYLFKINIICSVIAIVLGIFTVMIPFILKGRYATVYGDYGKAWDILESCLNSTMKAFDFIKMNNLYFYFEKKYLNATKSISRVAVDLDKTVYMERSLKTTAENMGSFGMYGVIAFLIYKNIITFGQVIICLFLGKQLIILLSNIVNEYHNIQSYKISKDRINEILNPEDDNQGTIINNISNLIFDKVSFNYVEEKTVLSNITLSINKGDKILVKGLNGAGKSTLIKLILNLYDDFKGKININGIDIRIINKNSYKNFVGYVPQQQCFLLENALENLTLFNNNLDNINKYCDEFGISINELKNKAYYELSGGQKQKICLIRALVGEFDLLIFDEPTNYLDHNSIQAFKSIIRNLNKTVIVVSHESSLQDVFEKKIILKEGSLEVEDLNTCS